MQEADDEQSLMVGSDVPHPSHLLLPYAHSHGCFDKQGLNEQSAGSLSSAQTADVKVDPHEPKIIATLKLPFKVVRDDKSGFKLIKNYQAPVNPCWLLSLDVHVRSLAQHDGAQALELQVGGHPRLRAGAFTLGQAVN